MLHGSMSFFYDRNLQNVVISYNTLYYSKLAIDFMSEKTRSFSKPL